MKFDIYDEDNQNLLACGGIGLLIAIVLAVCYIPVHDTQTIKYFGWEYNILIEEQRTVEEEGWYLPSGAREKDHYHKWKGSHQVPNGYDSNGNVTYETVQDYGTWYVYDIDKWFENRNITTTELDKNPYWGTYTLADKERVGKRTETYEIYTVEDSDKIIKWTTDKDIWESAEVGSTVRISHRRFSKKILKMEVM